MKSIDDLYNNIGKIGELKIEIEKLENDQVKLRREVIKDLVKEEKFDLLSINDTELEKLDI